MNFDAALGNIHWISVFVAAVSSFVTGAVWYGPLFGKAWMNAFGISEEALKKRSAAFTFTFSFILAFIAALMLEMFIGSDATFAFGAIAGFLAGFGWVATFLGILYLFEMRSLSAYLINAGYCIITLTIMGAILGAW